MFAGGVLIVFRVAFRCVVFLFRLCGFAGGVCMRRTAFYL